jgi:hypothetical protein
VQQTLNNVLAEATWPELARVVTDGKSVTTLRQTIDRNKGAISSTIQMMPSFVFHRDLHAGNTLRTASGEVFVVDWEQWSLEPIGYGWLPYIRRGAKMRVPDVAQIAKRRSLSALNESNILLMAALSGYQVAAARKPRD